VLIPLKNQNPGIYLASYPAEPDCEVTVEPSLPLSTKDRIGLHYFPDTLHYRARDLEVWLPHLSRMGISWLTLLAPLERAIPEYFLKGLFSSGIQPVLHFQIPTQALNSTEGLCLLFSNYARWGVQYVALYDRPNIRSNWSPSAWAQADLVERFLDQFVPLAESALDEGLVPIFPPLEPGGDYWDLSFLQSALGGLQRRGQVRLLDKLALGAYAWAGDRSLEWGAGGPERWSQAVPYSTPAESEDQRGFRIFDWYSAISQRVLGKRLPLFLLRTGSMPNDHIGSADAEPDYLAHAERNLTIARLITGEAVEGYTPVPAEVVAANFWLLSAHEKSAFSGQSWFKTEEEKLPVVTSFYRLAACQILPGDAPEISRTSEAVDAQASELSTGGSSAEIERPPEGSTALSDAIEASQTLGIELEPDCDPVAGEAAGQEAASLGAAETGSVQPLQPEPQAAQPANPLHTISHYVLLPLYAWGAADWDLEVIQPFLQESHPTVGFSLTEARLASRVTVVGGDGAISAEALDMLRAAGCKVERVMDDGTLVAS
jgi:hypothetical protein